MTPDRRLRVEAWEPSLGALVTVLDQPGTGAGPLAGTAVGVKDLIAVRGAPRLLGAPELADPTPSTRDATLTASLREAGAEVLATTALHPLAFGVVTPGTGNPRCPDRIAGGSSGGSAAALAAGLVDLALGTDTGGSIRIPAACCGVVGFKPTTGVLPLDGVQPLAPSLDSPGPLARSVDELGRALSMLGGPPAQAADPGRRWRLGVLAGVRRDPLDRAVSTAWERSLDLLAADGAEVCEVAGPDLWEAGVANGLVVAAEAAEVHRTTMASNAPSVPRDVRARLEYGAAIPPEQVAAAHGTGRRLRERLAELFTSVDVLVLPTLPCRVPRRGATTVRLGDRDERITGALARYTGPFNLAGVPAGSVPVGIDDGDGPIGLQVVGPHGADATVLAVMADVERVTGGPWPVVPTPRGSTSAPRRVRR